MTKHYRISMSDQVRPLYLGIVTVTGEWHAECNTRLMEQTTEAEQDYILSLCLKMGPRQQKIAYIKGFDVQEVVFYAKG